MIHAIRLRGGWTSTSESGQVTHTRNFGRPRTLDANERVWLICERVQGPSEIRLNGERIGGTTGAESFAADITDHLQARNRLELAVESSKPLGEVALEIRSSAS
jgi:hypothetical protein